MINWSDEKTEVPRGLQSVILTLTGASLGSLVAATFVAATASSAVPLPVLPGLWITAVAGGIIGLFWSFNSKEKEIR